MVAGLKLSTLPLTCLDNVDNISPVLISGNRSSEEARLRVCPNNTRCAFGPGAIQCSFLGKIQTRFLARESAPVCLPRNKAQFVASLQSCFIGNFYDVIAGQLGRASDQFVKRGSPQDELGSPFCLYFAECRARWRIARRMILLASVTEV